MESVATLLALIVGAMAMVRYYAKKDFTILLIGVGFLFTASLDGFHTVFTSSYFKAMLPADMSPQIAWSWIASRQYLAVLMTISWLVWFRGYTQNTRRLVSERWVLHVEDNADIQKIITLIIGDEAEVFSATTLHEATKILNRERFDLVILDLNLPDGSGEDLLSRINRPGRPSVPVIVFSANPAAQGTAERVSAVLVKSRTTNEMLAKIIRSHTSPIKSRGVTP